jgi:hypothetical protein
MWKEFDNHDKKDSEDMDTKLGQPEQDKIGLSKQAGLNTIIKIGQDYSPSVLTSIFPSTCIKTCDRYT